jgi:hypothetical protein
VPLGAAGGKVGPDAGKISPAQQAGIRALNFNSSIIWRNGADRKLARILNVLLQEVLID